MEKQYIAVMDSGIGGISVLIELIKNFPFESFLYFGDNENAPYGNRTKQELLSLSIHNINILKKYPIKAIVLACNTLSVNLLNEIEEYSNVKTFGVFPPVEKCAIDGKSTLLFATNMTCQNYSDTNNLKRVGFVDLAKKIEQNVFNLEKINILSCQYNSAVNLSTIKKGEYFNVIIGCTHYNFIKNQINDHFRPQFVIDGIQNLILKLEQNIKIKKSLVNSLQNRVLFIGKNADFNKKVFVFCGQKGLNYDKNIQKNLIFFPKRVDSGQKV